MAPIHHQLNMENSQNSYNPWGPNAQVAASSDNSSPTYNPWGSAQAPGKAGPSQGYNPWSSTPQDVTNAEENLGNQDYNGYCETFQEKMSGSPEMGTTAAAAWNNYAKQGDAVPSLNSAKAGDLVYFAGDGGLGHTGIISGKDSQGNITFVSATNNGVENVPVNQWLHSTGQQLLGIVPK